MCLHTLPAVNMADSQQIPLPTAEEFRAMIPPEGRNLNEVLAIFGFKKGMDGERKQQFTKLMRANSRWDAAAKLLKPLES